MGLPDTSPVPKKDSMGMDYIAVYDGDEPSDGKTIKVSLDRVQRSGVRTEPAEARVLVRPVRAVGTVAIDERRVTIVTMRSDGYVEDLFVNTTGQIVRAGEPLFRVYSPDIQQASADLAGRQDAGPARRHVGLGKSLEGAMQRLRNLGVPEARIREIRDSGSNPRTIDWPAPAGGTVIVKRIINGQKIACRRRTLSHRRSDQCLGDRRRRGRRSRRHQARRPRHRDVPRLSQPAGRGQRHLHLSAR